MNTGSEAHEARVDGTFGALLIAATLSSILFGVLTVQTHSYFQNYADDHPYLKFLVASVWSRAIDLLHQLCASALPYIYTVHRFSVKPEDLTMKSWVVSVALILEPLTAFIVQLYFAHRYRRVNGNNIYVCGTIFSTAIISFAFGESNAGTSFPMRRFEEFSRWPMLIIIWLVGSALCDILVTIFLSRRLWLSKTGFKSTDRFITRFVVWSINTGLTTSLAAIIDLIVYLASKDNLIHLIFNFALAKIYSNMLLANLNRRKRFRVKLGTDNHWTNDLQMSPMGEGSTTIIVDREDTSRGS